MIKLYLTSKTHKRSGSTQFLAQPNFESSSPQHPTINQAAICMNFNIKDFWVGALLSISG